MTAAARARRTVALVLALACAGSEGEACQVDADCAGDLTCGFAEGATRGVCRPRPDAGGSDAGGGGGGDGGGDGDVGGRDGP